MILDLDRLPPPSAGPISSFSITAVHGDWHNWSEDNIGAIDLLTTEGMFELIRECDMDHSGGVSPQTLMHSIADYSFTIADHKPDSCCTTTRWRIRQPGWRRGS